MTAANIRPDKASRARMLRLICGRTYFPKLPPYSTASMKRAGVNIFLITRLCAPADRHAKRVRKFSTLTAELRLDRAGRAANDALAADPGLHFRARCHSLSDFIDSRTHSLFGRGLGNGMGEETPTVICFIPSVAPATEGVTRKAVIGSLDADRRTGGDL